MIVFSSPELKAQLSFSDHLSSVVCLSVCLYVCPSVCLSVRPSVNFSHFHLLLQNHWTNFNQTWPKASLGEGDSSLFKWRARPFPSGDNYEIAKNTLTKLESLLLQNHWANFNQTWPKASLGKGDSSLFKWRVLPFSKGKLLRNSENTLTKLKNLLLQNHWANFNQTWHKAS